MLLLSVVPYVCLTVEDDGRGMDEETRNGIFEPFFHHQISGPWGWGWRQYMELSEIMMVGSLWTLNWEGEQTVRIYLPAIEVETKKPKETKVEVATGTGNNPND